MQVESRLLDYIVLEARIVAALERLRSSGGYTGGRGVALSMGPGNAPLTQGFSSAHTGRSRREWLDEFYARVEKMPALSQTYSDEIAECIEQQEEIQLMVRRAGLDAEEALYCELRYFQGLMVKDLPLRWPKRIGESRLNELRRRLLQKIADRAA
jgi:hypothetical protein